MSVPDPARIACGDVIIDLAARQLWRAGTVQPLEPKAFGVLALLVSGPGRVFTRDEILDAVWSHRHVTPGVLNRIITLLRQALGEDAQNPRLLHTVHGIGYRFDPVPPTAGAAPAMPLPSGDDEQGPPLAARPRPAALLHALGALLGLALMAASVFAFRTAPAVASPTLIVMPLKAIGSGVADNEVASGVSEQLIGALAGIDGLRVIARESTAVATANPEGAGALLQRLGVTHTLEGSLRQSGDRLRIHMRLLEAGSGRALWTQDYECAFSDVFALEREISQSVASALALRLGLAAATPVQKGGDADYYRRYTQARRMLEGGSGRSFRDLEQTEASLRTLLSEHPQDARVLAALALALDIRAHFSPRHATVIRAEALRMAEAAQRRDPSLPEPYQVLAAAACRGNEWERCQDLYRRMARLGANRADELMYRYPYDLAALGYLDQALAVSERLVANDPLNPQALYVQARILDTMGRHEEARRIYARARTPSTGRWFNAFWRGDHAAAIAQAQAMRSDPVPAQQVWAASYEAFSRAWLEPQRWPQVHAAIAASEQATGQLNFLRAVVPDADVPAAIAQLENLRMQSYSSFDLLLWTRDQPALRRHPAFQVYLQRTGIAAYWRKHGLPRHCREAGERFLCE